MLVDVFETMIQHACELSLLIPNNPFHGGNLLSASDLISGSIKVLMTKAC